MELSILIPVYNFEVDELVLELHNQCIYLNLNFEILLFDDYSDDCFHVINKKLSKLNNTIYKRFQENLGRSKTRNILLKNARFENCLVLDCDLRIDNSFFIDNYLSHLNGNSVIVGGHKYDNSPPQKKEYLLHWKYGRKTESQSLRERLTNPYHSFKTNSFLIKKEVFKKVKFDELIVKYGHEDTLFSLDLELNNIPIEHIDNNVVHVGLDTAEGFLKKQEQAIHNLLLLTDFKRVDLKKMIRSKLLSNENVLVFRVLYFLFSNYGKDRLNKKLLSRTPSLHALVLWKYFVLKELRDQKSYG